MGYSIGLRMKASHRHIGTRMPLAVRSSMPTIVKSFVLLTAAVIAAACGGGGTEPASPGSISLTPNPPAAIAAGSSVQLAVTVLDTRGQPMSGQSVTFSSSNNSVATVSQSG